MKRLLTILLSGLFLLGISATAYAVHAEIPAETQAAVAKGETQVTIGGSIRIRGEVRDNVTDFNDQAVDKVKFYDQRTRLSIAAKVTDKASGFIMVEGGNAANSDTYTWGEGAVVGATGGYQEGNKKQGAFSILESWIQYKGDVVGLKAGHMPLALGNKLFFDHSKFGDDAIVVFADPTKEIHVGLLTAKFTEGNTQSTIDDTDAYVALATFKSGAVSLSADITRVQDRNFNGASALGLYNYGGRAEIKAGPATLKVDGELQRGKSNTQGEPGTSALKFTGYALLASANVAAGPARVGVEYGQGSGDKMNPAPAGPVNEVEGFITSLSSGVPYPAFVYGPRARTACNTPGAGTTNSGICNTTYIKGSVGAKAGDLDFGADVIWLRSTEMIAGQNDKDIGVEIDGKVTYKLAKNLVYWIEGGYLVVDDFYQIHSTKSVNHRHDPDNAYAVRHGLELTF